MPMNSWDEVPRGTTHQTVDGLLFKHNPSTDQWSAIHFSGPTYRTALGLGTSVWLRCDAPTLKLIPKPTPIGTHRGSKQRLMVAVGGPWDGERIVLPKPSGSPHGLPIRVGEWHGRYNLDTGEWSDMKAEAVV